MQKLNLKIDSTGKTPTQSHFDLIIIGGGSAAFSAAIKADELGLSTLMVNAGLPFGGTCVNVGCVPSKYMVRAGEAAYNSSYSNFPAIKPNHFQLDFGQLGEGNKTLVSYLQKEKYLNVVGDFEKLSLLEGWAEFVDKKTIRVNDRHYTGMKFLIATGSRTNIPDIPGIEEVDYLTNESFFDLKEMPESITIFGAGYIGCELAMAYNRLGFKIRMLQYTDQVLKSQTPDISEAIEKKMLDEGIELLPNAGVESITEKGDTYQLHCKFPDGSYINLTEKGRILVATGVEANLPDGIQNLGMELSENSHIVVDSNMGTNLAGIYAAGDVANTPAYVYTAAFEGKVAVENAFTGNTRKVDYSALPWVIFTDPQLAGAGIEERQAEKADVPYEVSKIDLKDVPAAMVAQKTQGFIKLIRNPETDQLLGGRVVAPEGGELAKQISMAIQYDIKVNDLAESFYPYLTMSEGIKLAALEFDKDVSKLSCCAT